MRLTDRDQFAVSVHVHLARVTEEIQLVEALWPPTRSGRKNGQRRLRTLQTMDLLDLHIAHIKCVRRVALLCAGEPGAPAPDCAELSRESRAAWSAVPVQRAVVYTATRRARLIFGGTERHRVHALPQLSHDLGVAACLFELLRTDRQLAARWRSEDEGLLPAGFGDAQPDAVIVDEAERPSIAVEFAADYGPERFTRLLNSFTEQRLAYRIYKAHP